MTPSEFAKHNEQVKQVWEAFRAGKPTRVPVVFGVSENFVILDPALNEKSYTYRQYCQDPDVMMEVQLARQKWVRWHVHHDAEMGPPSDAWDEIYINFLNAAEAGWMGCPLVYGDGGAVPDTEPILRDNKEKLYDLEIPDPLHGNLMGTVYEHYEYLTDKLKNYEFEGLPVKGVIPVVHMTDGPFTLAAKLRGATEICIDVYESPEFVHDLMNFVTDAIIVRGKAWYGFMGVEYPMQEWLAGFADDCAEFLSVEKYRQFVLPYHRRIVETFSKGGPNHIHMCGRAQHLFKTMQQELNIQDFYVGYFTDMGAMRDELGEQVKIAGECIHPTILQTGEPGEIRNAVRERITTGAMKGGNLVLAATVAPSTSAGAMRTAYEAVKEYGRYS